MLTIHLIEWPGQFPRHYQEWLTSEEKQKAANLLQREKGQRWAFFRAVLRQILSQQMGCEPVKVPFQYGEHGKPSISGFSFNLSHSGDLAVLSISDQGPIGIDLEEKSRVHRMLRIEEKIAHPREIDSLAMQPTERAHQLLRLWCAKEATLKAIGTGLVISPARVNLNSTLTRIEVIEGLNDYAELQLQELNLPGFSTYQAHLAAPCTQKPHFQCWSVSTDC